MFRFGSRDFAYPPPHRDVSFRFSRFATGLSPARILVQATAAALTPLQPSALSPRYPSCSNTSYAALVLTDGPISYWRLPREDPVLNCGLDAVSGTLGPELLAANATGRGAGASAAAPAPAFLGQGNVTAPVPLNLYSVASSLFANTSSMEVGITLEAMVMPTERNRNASVVAVDFGVASGGFSLGFGCAGSCFYGAVPLLVLPATAGAGSGCREGAAALAPTVGGLLPYGLWRHVAVALKVG